MSMGEYEPDDSRDVTNVAGEAPGEPPRTGPREDAARAAAQGERSEAKQKRESKEEAGEGTARDATGEKQEGFAEVDPEEKARLQRQAGGP
ncbi:hypothetical protein [Tsuneonella sp. HG222]